MRLRRLRPAEQATSSGATFTPVYGNKVTVYWVDRAPYDEPRYPNALRQRKAPLLKFAANNVT